MTMYRRCTITGRDDVAGRRADNRVLDVIHSTPIYRAYLNGISVSLLISVLW
jgi:hypothetical protein